MADADNLDDEYVARLLAEDAKKTSLKYSSQGLSAFLPKRRTADAPKPNTRFLSHIVREADTHNAALKRREEVEARRRLRELRQDEERPRKRARTDETNDSKRNRLIKDIVSAASSEHPGKRSRRETPSRLGGHQQEYRATGSRHSRKHRHDKHSRISDKSGSDEHRGKSSLSDSEPAGSHMKTQDGRHRRRDKSRQRDTDRCTDLSKTEKQSDQVDGNRDSVVVGPGEPVQKRGRGAYKLTSGIDDRFAQDYDPSQDVSLNSNSEEDAEDWDMALEAMRDRAKWRKNQASRMKDAGFGPDDILKWERGASIKDVQERDLANVKWSRKGQVREWDAGKVLQ